MTHLPALRFMPRWKMDGAGLVAWALLALALSLLLAGCAVPEWQKPGTPRSEIERSMGRPTLSLPLDGGGTRLVYSRQPAGQQVYHMDFDANQRLVRVEQALTIERFHALRNGEDTRENVRQLFGPPALIDRGAGGGGLFGVFAVQAQAARLGHGNAVLQRALLDGRGLQLHAAPGGTVGLGQHQGDGKARSEQAFKGNARELGRAGKNDDQAAHGRVLEHGVVQRLVQFLHGLAVDAQPVVGVVLDLDGQGAAQCLHKDLVQHVDVRMAPLHQLLAPGALPLEVMGRRQFDVALAPVVYVAYGLAVDGHGPAEHAHIGQALADLSFDFAAEMQAIFASGGPRAQVGLLLDDGGLVIASSDAHWISPSAFAAGFVAVLVGFTSSVALVFQAAQAFHATPEQIDPG